MAIGSDKDIDLGIIDVDELSSLQSQFDETVLKEPEISMEEKVKILQFAVSDMREAIVSLAGVANVLIADAVRMRKVLTDIVDNRSTKLNSLSPPDETMVN